MAVADRIAARATCSSSSRMSVASRSRNASGTSAIRRAASARSRAPSAPVIRTIASSSVRAAIEILCRAGRSQERGHPRPDREVLEVSELLDLRQRIDAHLARQIEQRFGANAKVGILEHRDRHCADLAIARCAEERQCPPPDIRFRVLQTACAAPAASSASAALRAIRARSGPRRHRYPRASPAAPRLPTSRSSPTPLVRCRGDGDGCFRGSFARTPLAAARRRPPTRR